MSTTPVTEVTEQPQSRSRENLDHEQVWRPYQNQLPFRRADLEKVPDDAYGLYGLWYRRRCLYVGQAKSQPIARRLEQHWRRTHNADLAAWIKAKGSQLRVSYTVIKTQSNIDALEAEYIRRFQPITNKQLK